MSTGLLLQVCARVSKRGSLPRGGGITGEEHNPLINSSQGNKRVSNQSQRLEFEDLIEFSQSQRIRFENSLIAILLGYL